MEKRTIEDVKYLFKRCKEENKPKPIIFLGAGISVSAGIPLANQIIEKIFETYSEKPQIKRLIAENINNYYQIMRALSADERRDLFYSYITDENVKINVANIYLAQLLKENYIDYVFTVNFDDLFLKACSLFNFLPPVYDISNLQGYTTTNFQEKSITYLHGQYYGQWLLNSEEEIKKVKEAINDLFNRVCHKRPWIIIGYSGQDEVFDELAKFQNFDNELYWIGFNDVEPSEKVTNKLLDIPNKSAYWVSGYDADSFFLKLHAELGLETPGLFNKPFSFLLSMINNIKEIENSEKKLHKELFQNAKERITISTKWIHVAIKTIENEDSIERFKQEIIDAMLKDDFSENKAFHFITKIKEPNFSNANIELASYFSEWGCQISELGKSKNDENLYLKSFEKFEKAAELNPLDDSVFYNWGTVITELAKLTDSVTLYFECFEKFKKATELNPTDPSAFYNWGTGISRLAKMKDDENLYFECFEKFKKATELNPKEGLYLYNWGTAIAQLAGLKGDENLYNESFEKFEKATKLNPKDGDAFENWGVAISDLATLKEDKNLFKKSFEKFEKAGKLKSKDGQTFVNWGTALINSSYLYTYKEREDILMVALEKSQIAYKMTGDSYNLACTYSLLGIKEKALQHLKETLDKNHTSVNEVIYDRDWDLYTEDPDFKEIIKQFEK